MLEKSISRGHIQESSFHSPHLILDNIQIEKYIKQVCPKMVPFYHRLSDLYLVYNDKDPKEFKNQLTSMMISITLPSKLQQKDCHQNTSKIGYSCECMLQKSSIVCSGCFLPEKHKNHMFKLLQDTKGSFCDCGNPEHIKIDLCCSKHQHLWNKQQLSNEQTQKLVKQYRIFISLILSIRMVEKGINHKDILFIEAVDLFSKTVQIAEGMLLIMEHVLLSQIDEVFLGYQISLMELLIRSQTWPQQIGQRMIRMLIRLCKNKRIALETVKIWLRLTSLSKFPVSPHLQAIQHEVLSSCIIQLNKQQEDQLIKPQNIRYLIPHSIQLGNQFQRNFTVILIKQKRQLFHRLNLAMIQHVPLEHWFSKSKQLKNYLANWNWIVWMFTSFIDYPEVNKNQILIKMIRQSFRLIIKDKQTLLEIYLVFIFSLFSSIDFKIQSLSNMTLNEISDLLSVGALQDISQIVSDRIEQNLQKLEQVLNGSKAYNSKIHTFHHLTAKVFMIIYHKIKNRPFVDQRWQNITTIIQDLFSNLQESFNESVQTIKNATSLIKLYIFINQSSHSETVLASMMPTNNISEPYKTILEDIMIMHPGVDRKQFKAQVYKKQYKNQQYFVKYMKECYEEVKKRVATKRLNHSISFNSQFCKCEQTQQKHFRFRDKIGRPSGQVSELINYEQTLELVKLYSLFMENYNAIEQSKQNQHMKQFEAMMNELFELYVTIYLNGKRIEVAEVLELMISTDRIVKVLKKDNIQVIGLLQEHRQNKQQFQGEKSTDMYKNRLKLKRQQKMKEMKQKQEKVIQKLGLQKQSMRGAQNTTQHACIICQLGEEAGQLMYLSHIKYSTVLVKSVINKQGGFFLFTTCGHLIHDPCLIKSLSGNKNFATNYSCFLCRKVSNIRLPLNCSVTQQTQIRAFYQEMLTLIGLHRQNLKENMKGQPPAVFAKLQKQHQAFYKSSQTTFPLEIYKSIFYQIYFYFLNHTQIFNYYMLPIIPNLIEFVKCHLFEKDEKKIEIGQNDFVESTKISRKILRNMNYFISGKYNKFNHVEQQKINEQEAHSQLSEDQSIKQINKLFMKLSGNKAVQLRRVRNFKNFNIKNLPNDLIDLKRMNGQCPYCKKMTDDMRICFLCDQRGCLNCLGIWCTHLYQHHFGTSVTVSIRGAFIYYEALNLKIAKKRLYKNCLGDYYNNETVKEMVKEGEYILDEPYYESVVEDLLLEKVETDVEVFQRQRNENQCRVQ